VPDLRSYNPIPPLLTAAFKLMPPFAGTMTRSRAMRLAGFNMGHGSLFWGWPSIGGSGELGLLKIGEDSGFNVRCHFDLEDDILIGNHVSVGHEVMFITHAHDTSDPRCRAGRMTTAPIVVEDGAWLGARSTILPGVRIGAGAVIGASVVVAEDVPEHTLIMGTQKISLAKWR
jgi:maltose O-acetyltransferase